jgi:hypothetical protein
MTNKHPPARRRIARYVQANPPLLEGATATHALVGGELYRVSAHPDGSIDVYGRMTPDLIECHECGELAPSCPGPTPCCGALSDPPRDGRTDAGGEA